ncbi:MAG: pyridoxal-phosphate dependent enzyme [Bacteroidetes bacterium]|nr:MAG: pyridoxal-phosphate dependent enzyme [Bacteroidota bacterium]
MFNLFLKQPHLEYFKIVLSLFIFHRLETKTIQNAPFNLSDLLALYHGKPFIKQLVNAKIQSLWRYENFLPLGAKNAVSLGEGFTPLLPIALDGKVVHIKQEQLFPTGSYKDRGASVLISMAREAGVKQVVQDSSGNAGCAIAAYAAHAKMACEIYVPAQTASAKLAQIRMYGAEIVLVEGTREDTAKAAIERAKHVYYASHCYHQGFYQGTKTFAYEVCEQLDWQAPDTLVLPAGNGTLVIGCYLGLYHLLQSNIIDKMPRIIGIQTANCAPLYHSFIQQTKAAVYADIKPTIAEGIAIASPVQGPLILDIIEATHGKIITVTEEEIVAALQLCGGMGFYIEPTSAATIAGVRNYLTTASAHEVIVSLFSGHGLKSTEKILSILNK